MSEKNFQNGTKEHQTTASPVPPGNGKAPTVPSKVEGRAAPQATKKEARAQKKKAKRQRVATTTEPANEETVLATNNEEPSMITNAAPEVAKEAVTEVTATSEAAEQTVAPNAPSDKLPSEASAPSGAVTADSATETPVDTTGTASLRLRMKVWTDPVTGKRYLMPTARMRDVVNGVVTTDLMIAYAMSDDDTKLVTLRAGEWNTLPFFYFQEDGPAPRLAPRPIDVVRIQAP